MEDPRETSPPKQLKDKKSWKILIKKKRRKSDHGQFFTKKQIRMKKRQERLENKEAKRRSLADRRKIRLEKLKKREERLKAQQEALQHLDREKALNGDNQKTDDQLEYHYVCNLCKLIRSKKPSSNYSLKIMNFLIHRPNKLLSRNGIQTSHELQD